jgi:transposase-like protein
LLTIQGTRQSLGRAIDQAGKRLHSLVQRRWAKKAAQTCFRKLLKALT